jgi:hypothetical protein
MNNNWNNSLSANSEPVNIDNLNGYVSENENNMINTPGGIKLRKIRIPTAKRNKNRKAAASGPSILRVLKSASEHKKTPKPANPVSRPPLVPKAVSAEPPVPSSPPPMPAFIPSEETVNYPSSFNGNSSPQINGLFNIRKTKRAGRRRNKRRYHTKKNHNYK